MGYEKCQECEEHTHEQSIEIFSESFCVIYVMFVKRLGGGLAFVRGSVRGSEVLVVIFVSLYLARKMVMSVYIKIVVDIPPE